MGFVMVASKEEVSAGKMKLVEANGKLVLLAKVAGEYYAIGNKCTYRGCKLSSGILEGENVKYPCHGSKFNAKTGEVMHGSANKLEPKYSEGGKRPGLSRCLTTFSLICRSNNCE